MEHAIITRRAQVRERAGARRAACVSREKREIIMERISMCENLRIGMRIDLEGTSSFDLIIT